MTNANDPRFSVRLRTIHRYRVILLVWPLSPLLTIADLLGAMLQAEVIA